MTWGDISDPANKGPDSPTAPSGSAITYLKKERHLYLTFDWFFISQWASSSHAAGNDRLLLYYLLSNIASVREKKILLF